MLHCCMQRQHHKLTHVVGSRSCKRAMKKKMQPTWRRTVSGVSVATLGSRKVSVDAPSERTGKST